MSGVKWDWSHSSQSNDYFVKVQNKLTNKCLNHKSNWRRLSGLPLGIAQFSIALVKQISLIGEQLIKGVGNLIGAAVPGSKCSAKKGAKQLFVLLPINILRLILLPAGIPYALVVQPILVAVIPDWVLKQKQLNREENSALKQRAKAKLADA